MPSRGSFWSRDWVHVSWDSCFIRWVLYHWATLPLWWLSSKEFACSAGGVGSFCGFGRSPGEGNGNPLQYSCLGNPMDRGASWASVHGVTRKSIGHNWATKQEFFLTQSLFYSGLQEAHPQWGGQSVFIQSTDSMLVLSRSSLADTPRGNV